MKLRAAIPITAFVALCLVLSLTAPFGCWPWSHVPGDFRLPLLGFITNLVLVAVTWIYVLITREQLRELQAAREPNAVLHVRIPGRGLQDIKYGRGHDQFRDGSPIYLDVWNVGGPTIMVLRVSISLKDDSHKEVLEPQVLVESGKVAPLNISHPLMRLVSVGHGYTEEIFTLADETAAEVHFAVDYFSLKGEQSIQARYKFRFKVGEQYINTRVE